ncbi:MAG: hypothetical protein JRJ35_11275 [Deltaproteobacteria bacterium]|nr:hypothetical protein [Deltaproteobacteria bacterium]
MGLRRFFKSLTNAEAMGEEIIRMQEDSYEKARQLYPDSDPHVLLAQVWLTRQAAHGRDVHSEAMQITAFTETMQFACLPYPQNIRALALFIVYKERPDIIQRFTRFSQEFQELMAPVSAAVESGDFERIYRKHNPNMPQE